MADRLSEWINTVNTTSFRIVVSVIVASIGMVVILLAMVFGWAPTDKQITVLTGLGFVALTREGFDVTQFIGKRFSDAGYAAAKQTPAATMPATPSPITVQVGSPAPETPSSNAG